MSATTRKKHTGESGNEGEFGTITRHDADVHVASHPEGHDATGAALVERFGFDVRSADPVEFDEHAATAAKELAKARSRRRVGFDALHRAVGDRKKTGGNWAKSDEQVLEAAREWVNLADGGAASAATGARIRGPLHDAQEAQEGLERAREQVDGLDEAFQIRGVWNRAFLVSNASGHVHSSTGCSTCRPTTQYAWLTDYSGANEDTIVRDAGHRACTTCYPTAPVGDANALPTKMYTPDEVAAQKAREKKEALAKLTPAEKRARKRAEKLAAAVSSTGEPLRFEEDLGDAGVMREVFSTEKDAERAWQRGLGDTINLRSTAGETLPEFAEARRNSETRADWHARMRPKIAKTLAQKHGTTALDEKNHLDTQAKAYFAERIPRLAECFQTDEDRDYLEP